GEKGGVPHRRGVRRGSAAVRGEAATVVAEGRAELKLITDRQGAVAPAGEETVQFEDDDDADEDGSDDGAIQFHPYKYHAVALLDKDETKDPKERLLHIPSSEGIRVTYELWRGHQKVVSEHLERPYGSEGVYYFCAPKFKRTGNFKLRFGVAASGGAAAGAASIPALEYNIQVSAKYAHTGASAALHKLNAMDFQTSKHREEDLGSPVTVDLPFQCQEVPALKLGLVALLKALPKGALKEGTPTGPTGGADLSASALAHDSQEGDTTPASGWTPSLRESWHSQVACAETSQELMEALVLLESCLDPKWLKSWFKPVQQYMPTTSYLLRLATPAAVALRLFELDQAILYNKVSSAAQRSLRLRSGTQVVLEDLPTQRQTRGGGGVAASVGGGRRLTRSSRRAALVPEPKPSGRQTRTSRAAELQEARSSLVRGRTPSRQKRSTGKGRRGQASRDFSPGS
ncbi:unnamed protein product, partial [Discosporangium mesarthrocarpum]